VITFAVTVLNGLHQPGDARAARRVPRSGGGAKDTSAQRTRRRNRRLNTSPPARAGPLAGRTRLPAYFILTFFYATFFYPIMVHWSWGQARLSESPPSPMRPWGGPTRPPPQLRAAAGVDVGLLALPGREWQLAPGKPRALARAGASGRARAARRGGVAVVTGVALWTQIFERDNRSNGMFDWGGSGVIHVRPAARAVPPRPTRAAACGL